MVNFRKRIGMELTNKINKEMVKKVEGVEKKKEENEGKLLLDATCTPADIKYPTDVGILNKAREKTEKIIDKLYKELNHYALSVQGFSCYTFLRLDMARIRILDKMKLKLFSKLYFTRL